MSEILKVSWKKNVFIANVYMKCCHSFGQTPLSLPSRYYDKYYYTKYVYPRASYELGSQTQIKSNKNKRKGDQMYRRCTRLK